LPSTNNTTTARAGSFNADEDRSEYRAADSCRQSSTPDQPKRRAQDRRPVKTTGVKRGRPFAPGLGPLPDPEAVEHGLRERSQAFLGDRRGGAPPLNEPVSVLAATVAGTGTTGKGRHRLPVRLHSAASSTSSSTGRTIPGHGSPRFLRNYSSPWQQQIWPRFTARNLASMLGRKGNRIAISLPEKISPTGGEYDLR
jgi:hypothetical protein